MTDKDLVLIIWLTLLTIGFIFLVFDMFDVMKRIKKLDDVVTDLDSREKRIGQLVFDEIIKKHPYKEDKKIGVGKWIRIESDGTDGRCYWYGCSICHNKVPKSQYHIDYFSPYCPACGAKMKLESEVDA